MGKKSPIPYPLSASPSPSPSPPPPPSSGLEFTISLSPPSADDHSNRSSNKHYFHLPPRLSMVRTLFFPSSSSRSSSSSASTAAAASRDSVSSSCSSLDSTASSSSFSADLLFLAAALAEYGFDICDDDVDSPRPSSASEDCAGGRVTRQHRSRRLSSGYLSSLASRLSSVFNQKRDRVDHHNHVGGGAQTQTPDSSTPPPASCNFSKEKEGGSIPAPSPTTSAPSLKEAIRNYVKKMKPLLYDKLTSLHRRRGRHHNPSPRPLPPQKKTFSFSPTPTQTLSFAALRSPSSSRNPMTARDRMHSLSFSENLNLLRHPTRHHHRNRHAAASCPPSVRSSPARSGLLCLARGGARVCRSLPEPAVMQHHSASASSLEELQGAIDGAIAHCKSSWKGAE